MMSLSFFGPGVFLFVRHVPVSALIPGIFSQAVVIRVQQSAAEPAVGWCRPGGNRPACRLISATVLAQSFVLFFLIPLWNC